MPAEAQVAPRSTNIVAFSGLCLVLTFAWDVAYALLCDFLGPALSGRLFGGVAALMLFGVPILLCAGLGLVLGQWQSARALWHRLGAAAWCMVAPAVVLIPFFSFMCLVFGSCFGD